MKKQTLKKSMKTDYVRGYSDGRTEEAMTWIAVITRIHRLTSGIHGYDLLPDRATECHAIAARALKGIK